MKLFKISLLFLTLVMSTIVFLGCKDNAAKDKTGKEYTAAYICPMHCKGSGSAEPGKCPVCKMDYVQNKEAKVSGQPAVKKPVEHNHDKHHHDHDHNHDHDHSHEGHSH